MDRVVETFISLVKIDSPSRHEDEIRRQLIVALRKRGGKVRIDKKGNIHGVFTGLLANGPILLFNAHMDTVVPGNGVKPIILKDRITSDGTTVLGADDKAGLAGLLEMLTLLHEKKVLYKQIKVIITVEEEIGLQGAKALKFDDVKADYCFVLDSDGDVGSIVVKAPAQEIITATITGRAAHAGLNPEAGISAIKIAAEAITKMKVGRIDAETTANVGVIKGGVATNIIPEDVQIKAEARSHSETKLQKQLRDMKTALRMAAEKNGGNVDIEVRRSYNSVNVSKTAKIVEITTQASKKLKLNHQIFSSGGGSDASIIFGYGIPTVGLCIGMAEVHSKKEYITLKNLTTLPKYLVSIVEAAYGHRA
jgi:tripeptide aminopeptidase